MTVHQLPALYDGTSEIAGELTSGDRVRYVDTLQRRDKLTLAGLIAFNVVAGASFLTFLLWPSNVPVADFSTVRSSWVFVASITALGLMVCIETIRLVQSTALWAFASRAKDPVPIETPPGLRAAVMTTIVPGKEPLELVLTTLRAMKAIRHNGPMDVWLLDEGDDPEVKAACETIGVKHFSRKGVASWNQESGAYKAKTKAGNHNAWRDAHEHNYDIVAQMDPDHIPTPDFLERSAGYFSDPDVAFVVAPQVYGNLRDNWIAHGSAIQAYVFHGVIQRGGNGMQAPLLIGTNHLYRPSAWADIGGYQDSIIEDHLTSMAVYAHTNPETGNRYKGVYTPDILAVGEGPSSFTDYFNQQKRWAYGIWEIMTKHSPKLFGQVRHRQKLSFSLLQMFYPSVAVAFVLSNILTALYLLGGAQSRLPLGWWFALWAASMTSSLAIFFWLRKFNLVEHERRDSGMVGMGLLVLCAPIYVVAMLTQLTGRPLEFAVTAKGDLTSPDTLTTFRPHLCWAAVATPLLIANMGFGLGSTFVTVQFWLAVTVLTTLMPVLIHLGAKLSQRNEAQYAPQPFTNDAFDPLAGVPDSLDVAAGSVRERRVVTSGGERTRTG